MFHNDYHIWNFSLVQIQRSLFQENKIVSTISIDHSWTLVALIMSICLVNNCIFERGIFREQHKACSRTNNFLKLVVFWETMEILLLISLCEDCLFVSYQLSVLFQSLECLLVIHFSSERKSWSNSKLISV